MEELGDVEYNSHIESLRQREYPSLTDSLYLDNAGTPPVPRSLLERFSANMISNMHGNPHSSSTASQTTTQMIENVRLDVLHMVKADPNEFDVVFVANATAGVKLVIDAFRDCQSGFWYGYHRDSHTSIVGGREVAMQHQCFESKEAVDDWIRNGCRSKEQQFMHRLFTFPAQSNMNGYRLPLRWSREIRSKSPPGQPVYTLLDAAALVATCPLDLSDADAAPDFTVLSFYKIFGFPDLGALIVRKSSSAIMTRRKYFGGGTVDLVLCLQEQWHLKKNDSPHSHLEDGTLPIHSILALQSAVSVHRDLFGSFERISRHVSFLTQRLYSELKSLRHPSGTPVCQIYTDPDSGYTDMKMQGSTIALNFETPSGTCVQHAEVEKLAAVRNISLRTGGVCNPGGVSAALSLAPWELRRNFSAGARCGVEDGEGWVGEGKPTGIVRVSLGAASTMNDVENFLVWVKEFFIVHNQTAYIETPLKDGRQVGTTPSSPMPDIKSRLGYEQLMSGGTTYTVESITVYPIKSCAGFSVPQGQSWKVRREGLAWDREWCIVHQGTGTALSMKRYPHMAHIKPTVDLEKGILRIECSRTAKQMSFQRPSVEVPLSEDPRPFESSSRLLETGLPEFKGQSTRVCGDIIMAKTYQSLEISEFLSEAVGVPCRLARYSSNSALQGVGRQWRGVSGKHNLQLEDTITKQKPTHVSVPGSYPSTKVADDEKDSGIGIDSDHEAAHIHERENPILLANESPILIINRASVRLLNQQIKSAGNVHAGFDLFPDRFRANIVIKPLAPSAQGPLDHSNAYEEDSWCDGCHILSFIPCPSENGIDSPPTILQVLGACRRCQIVCVNPKEGEKDLRGEPFVTLAKTRREPGRGGVNFGIHCGLQDSVGRICVGQNISVTNGP